MPRKLLNEASALLDEALKLRPNYMEAMVYKGVVLKQLAARERDPKRAAALRAEADRFAEQAKKLRSSKVTGSAT